MRVGTIMGIVLSDMVPEKRALIMARAAEYAHNRVVGGTHYPADVEGGKISGSVIAAIIMQREDFKTEIYANAKGAPEGASCRLRRCNQI